MSKFNASSLIALDTSSTCTGTALYKEAEYITSGVIDLKKISDSKDRQNEMSLQLINLLNNYQPGIVVIERPPLVKDPQSLIMLSEIIGCVKGWAIMTGLDSDDTFVDYIEYTPSQWRALVKNEGESVPRKSKDCKAWDIAKVKSMGYDPVDDNEADAILIGQARINEFAGFMIDNDREE